MWWKVALLVFALASIAVLGGGFWLGAKSASMAAPKRAKPVVLPPCPNSPNCVSTQDQPQDGRHYLGPLKLTSNPLAELKIRLEATGCQILTAEPAYLQATCSSRLFGFVDDVEFVWLEKDNLLLLRSASRVGHSDFGANRKRILALTSGLK